MVWINPTKQNYVIGDQMVVWLSCLLLLLHDQHNDCSFSDVIRSHRKLQNTDGTFLVVLDVTLDVD